MTQIIDTTIPNTASNNLEGFVTNIPSPNLLEVTPIQTDNVTFGEYKTVTNVGGVRSEYMPQIEPNLNTSFQQTLFNLPISSSQILPTQSVPIPSNYSRIIESPRDIKIPNLSFSKLDVSSSMIPSTIPAPISTPRETSASKVVPYTFSPSQNEVIRSQSFVNSPIRSKIITESSIYSLGRKLYFSPTYRAYLGRKGKIHKSNHRRIKSSYIGKMHGALYRPKDYKKFDL